LSTANGGFSVQDQGYSSSNRTQAMVATTTSTATMQGSRLTPFTNIQSGIDAVVSGGAVNVASGTYTQSSTLRVDKGLTLTGAGEGLTVVDARGITNNYGVNVSADNVILRNFSVYGPTIFDATHQSAYGIKVSPGGGASARLHNLSIANVTSRGAGKAELDLNGVDGALIDHVTADGMPVGATSGTTQGAGIQLTDSANVTVTNTTTRNNAWGGIAIYQANRSYDQQANNITVAANNSLTETNPLYLQDESASRDFGALNLPGFSYAVRNTATIGTGPSAVQYSQYTWMQPTPQGSFDLAVNLLSPVSSYVQTWNGTAVTQNFHVGVGNLAGGGTQAMSISAATDRASSGATVTVHSVTLKAAAGGTGIAGTVTADGSGGIHINAPINLLGDTTLATRGADIVISGDVQNAPGVIGGLRLMAGTNTARGNVSLATGGAETNALGPLEVFSNRFNLQDTLWVKSYKIDALGDVALSGHTLRGQDPTATNTMNAGGNVTGSTINTGNVQISSNGDVSANVSGNDVSVNSVGNLDLTVTATNSATLHGDTVAATVSARDVAVTSQSNMNVDVTASNSATLSGQAVVATVVARDVAVTSQGDMNVGVVATNSATLQGGSVVANVASPVVSVGATNDAQISGVSGSITVDAPSGSVTGNFGQFTNEGGGLVSFNGKPQGNETLVASSVNNRVNPVGNPMSGDANPDEWSGIPAAPFDGAVKIQGRVHSGFSSPSVAGSFLDQGQSVELDLSPRNERRKK
jgi:hypothetical protein